MTYVGRWGSFRFGTNKDAIGSLLAGGRTLGRGRGVSDSDDKDVINADDSIAGWAV